MTLLLKILLQSTAPLLTAHLPQYKNDILHQCQLGITKFHPTSSQPLVNPVPGVVM